ncbi:Cloroperoxidase [Mycena rebaudengoi]|nr:Cloroperoxidase [Mycena rebaudengoi]
MGRTQVYRLTQPVPWIKCVADLANHGYLPHDGRNITILMITDAVLVKGMLLRGHLTCTDTPFLSPQNSVFSRVRTYLPSFQAIRLDALSLQNLVEHDASISRNDFALGDNRDRLADSVARNPDVVNTKKEFQLRTRDTGLYLSIFGSDLSGHAPKKFVNIFFREERLPIAERWKKSETLINTAGLEPLEQIIEDASGWTKTQSCGPLILGPSTTL